MTTQFDVKTFDVKRFDKILSCGLSQGLGTRGSQVCIEAAICEVLGMKHSDDPKCVASSVRSYKIALNDRNWSTPIARAEGLRDLGLAQLGSLGVVSDTEFTKRLAEKTIRVLIPTLFREVFPGNLKCLDAALRCEQEGTKEAAANAANAASSAANAANAAVSSAASSAANAANAAAYAAAYAANAAAYAAVSSAAYAAVSSAAYAAAYAASYADDAAAYAAADKYLRLSASLALEVLRELNSPGVSLL